MARGGEERGGGEVRGGDEEGGWRGKIEKGVLKIQTDRQAETRRSEKKGGGGVIIVHIQAFITGQIAFQSLKEPDTAMDWIVAQSQSLRRHGGHTARLQ